MSKMMSLSIFESRNLPATEDDPDATEHLEELRETNLRLRALVCELIAKNQQLRFQRVKEEGTLSANTDDCGREMSHPDLSEAKMAGVS